MSTNDDISDSKLAGRRHLGRAVTSGQRPDEILRVQATLGEGILWDSGRGLLRWTDIHSRRLYAYEWAGGALRTFDVIDRLASFGLVAGSDRLIAAFADGIGLYDTVERSIQWLYRPEMTASRLRFNDGKVDRRGRFWAGTMREAETGTEYGCLYSVEGKGVVRCHVEQLKIANGLSFSPDGRRMYFADSPTREISVYELIEPEGILGTRRSFALTPEGAFPDGAAVDVDGCLWSAHWGAGCVVRYTPAGKIDRVVQVPTCQPTCVCFGGPDRDVLCVTSAREGLGSDVLEREPYAGDVFLYRVGIQGLPEPQYRG